jgi:hypothetical protein
MAHLQPLLELGNQVLCGRALLRPHADRSRALAFAHLPTLSHEALELVNPRIDDVLLTLIDSQP